MAIKLLLAVVLLLFLYTNSCGFAQLTYPDLLQANNEPTQTISPTENQFSQDSLSQTISYYHLQVDYSSSSDRSSITPQNPDNILTIRLISQTGSFSRIDLQIGHIRIDQPIQSAKSNGQLHIGRLCWQNMPSLRRRLARLLFLLFKKMT